MFLFIRSFSLFIFLSLCLGNSFAEIKLRGGLGKDYKIENKTFKISEDLLSEKAYENLNEKFDENQNLVKELSKNNKIKDAIKLRGAGGGIYSQYADSVFLIVTSKGKGGIGSGSLIDSSGLILTNAHVVADNPSVQVVARPPKGKKLKDSKIYVGNVLLVNEGMDLAIVKVFGIDKTVKTIPLGSIQDISIAEEVHAIGHPKGLFWSYTKGVVSQIRPDYKWGTKNKKKYQATVIQTQTPISPGNSGGPLFSDKGKLIGVNTMKIPGENLNFAVAVEHAKQIINSDAFKQNLAKARPATKPSWIEAKYPNAKAYDSDKNGKTDTWYIDKDKDGRIDRALIDDNENGKIDAIMIDRDQNGKWELILVDKNEDGKVDYGIIDRDEDGKPDLIAFDDNGDKKWDRYQKI
jgi:S1-C subfamily serine protease